MTDVSVMTAVFFSSLVLVFPARWVKGGRHPHTALLPGLNVTPRGDATARQRLESVAGLARFLLIAAPGSQRRRIVGLDFHVCAGLVGVVAPHAGKTIGVVLPTAAGPGGRGKAVGRPL